MKCGISVLMRCPVDRERKILGYPSNWLQDRARCVGAHGHYRIYVFDTGEVAAAHAHHYLYTLWYPPPHPDPTRTPRTNTHHRPPKTPPNDPDTAEPEP